MKAVKATKAVKAMRATRAWRQPGQGGRPVGGLPAAIALSAAGALLLGLAPVVGLVTPRSSAAFVSWPLLLLLAGLPPALAGWSVRRGRPVLAAALLLGPAALAPGQIGVDAQFVVDPELSARPELLMPVSLDRLAPSAGLWMLFAGNLAVLAGGVIAGLGLTGQREPVPGDVDSGTSRRQGQLAFVLCAAVFGAVGVLMGQFHSDSPYLIPRAAVDSPPAVLVGSVLIAIAIVAVAGYVVSSADRQMARGGLLGVAIALGGVSLPPLVAATFVPQLHYAWGAVLGTVAGLTLAALASPAGRNEPASSAADVQLPSLTRLLMVTGGLSVAAGALAVIAAVSPQWEYPGVNSVSYPARMLLPAGLVIAGLGAGLLVRRAALLVRPALAIAWAVVPLAVAGALNTVFDAVQAGGDAGIGAWEAGLAGAVSAVAAVVCAFAGAVERDDVDLTEVVVRRAVAVPSLLVLPLAVGAFDLPVMTAPHFEPPGLLSNFDVASWGLVLALVAVVAAGVLAPVCRPERSAGLLGGAALIVGVHMLELPLTAGRVAGANPGAGLWWSVACLAGLVTAGVIALSRRG